MSGKWTQHIKKIPNKSRKAAAAASYVLYKCIDQPLSLCNELFVSHVESAALYGAEIWGVNNIECLNSVQSGFYKRVLWASKSASHYGLLRETGSVDIKCKAQQRAILYWLKCAKDLTSPLVATCYREQIYNGHLWVNTPWALKIKEILDNILLPDLWVGDGINDRGVYKNVKSHFFAYHKKQLRTKCQLMKSLQAIPLVDADAPPPYMTLCSKEARSGLLWLWLGVWVSHKHVILDNGVRSVKCPLCLSSESARHILADCPNTQKYRIKFHVNTYDFDFQIFRNCNDVKLLENLGLYLNTVRRVRGEAIQKIRGEAIDDTLDCVCNL